MSSRSKGQSFFHWRLAAIVGRGGWLVDGFVSDVNVLVVEGDQMVSVGSDTQQAGRAIAAIGVFTDYRLALDAFGFTP